MFTGIIRNIGTVKEFKREVKSVFLTIEREAFSESRVGDSIAIEGVCLTIIDLDKNMAEFELGPETITKTNLGNLKASDQVNIELPLRLSDPLGGHIVQGHIDATAVVVSMKDKGNTVTLVIDLPAELAGQVIEHGSLAINGVSLTIAKKEGTKIHVMLMQYTLDNTTLKNLKVGDKVNVELDMLVKYIAALINNAK